ncbi:MAG TPA: iron-sulfur cluster-binding protein [Flavobacteriales bacterium]|nr:iron-sulfur cluster-binding protein [Flavobacteriales bacterium]
MSETLQTFLQDSALKASSKVHREKLAFNIQQYDDMVVKAKGRYADLELAKKRAAHIKAKTLESLEKYLKEFEFNFTNNGGKLIWAPDADSAIASISKIVSHAQAKMLVKGKSMTTEEIHFNAHMEAQGVESVETDLGEYIVQLAGEPPYHIVTPAMHKSKEDVAELFHEKEGLPADSTPQDITAHVRTVLRKKFTSADIGVTGGNFLVADIGGVAVTENEGNVLLTASYPKIHIAIVGIEKMIPNMEDLDLFWSLLATHGTGQHMTAYNSIITGPRQEGEVDGPEEMYVVLLDNGRTNVLGQQQLRRALNCIRCGACLNGCPVYKSIGGHAYNTTYSGPIGSIITPHFRGMEQFQHLSSASSLCGKCTEVCPVKIDLHKMLIHNRSLSVSSGNSGMLERFTMFLWKKGMLKRKLMDGVSSGFKNTLLSIFFKKTWGERRKLPQIAGKSFSQSWKEKNDKS